MEVLNTIIGIPLGYILYFCYQICGSFGLAVLLFTLVTKILMFPLSLVSQKNSIVMVKMQPALEDIKQRFAGNSSLVLEEQRKLYKREHYSMVKGMLPLLLQIPIILGLINVIYNPLQHLLHADPQQIIQMIDYASAYLGISVADMGYSAQLKVMELAQMQPQIFESVRDGQQLLAMINTIDTQFLGVNLSANPVLLGLSVLYPILSGLSALILSLFQNRYNILQLNQGFWGKWGTAIFLVAFSAYFAAVLPCGVGLYWIAGNFLSIAVLALCNIVYPPSKYIDVAALPKKEKLSRETLRLQRINNSQLKKRERADRRRFFAHPQRRLVFYSEASGFYKYYQRLIEHLLANYELDIHYVSSDPNDQVFKLPEEHQSGRLHTYYIGPTSLISFMMRMDADMVIMSMPDLETFHIKRSLVRNDIEYVYLDHGIGSFHLVLREHALDHFDTIFAYGPNHIAEVRRLEELHNLPAKTIVETGFGLIDNLLESIDAKAQTVKQTQVFSRQTSDDKPIALVAPSWQKDNILELCLAEVLQPLFAAGFKVIVRPHPEFVKRFPDRCDEIRKNYLYEQETGIFILESDFSSNQTVYTADVVITDWSTIAMEFSFATKKPSLYVNTPMKVINNNWQEVGLEPLDIALRGRIGKSLDLSELEDIGNLAMQLIEQREQWRDDIQRALNELIFNIGHSEQAMAEYICLRLDECARRNSEDGLSKSNNKDNDDSQIKNNMSKTAAARVGAVL